jgi:hypothetical protein
VREAAQDLEPLGAVAPKVTIIGKQILVNRLLDLHCCCSCWDLAAPLGVTAHAPLVLGAEELVVVALEPEEAAGRHLQRWHLLQRLARAGLWASLWGMVERSLQKLGAFGCHKRSIQGGTSRQNGSSCALSHAPVRMTTPSLSNGHILYAPSLALVFSQSKRTIDPV